VEKNAFGPDVEKVASEAQIAIYGEINRVAPLPDSYKIGHVITKSGIEKFINIINECNARDQDLFDMYIYNDWKGWGITEVLENLVSSLLLFVRVMPQKNAHHNVWNL
jgi:hypothetical protein